VTEKVPAMQKRTKSREAMNLFFIKYLGVSFCHQVRGCGIISYSGGNE
jgi:hypothetical protein